MDKVKMICRNCGSEDVKLDAWATWDIKQQEWVLDQVFNEAWCESCEGTTKINGEVIKP